MNKVYSVLLAVFMTGFSFVAWAGNPDRAGESGAGELLINPWARSSGLYGLDNSRIRGLESMRVNVAGLSFTEGTEVVFARTHWLQGSETYLNAFGIAQSLGEEGNSVLGVNVMSVNFGEIERTSTSFPEGGLGTYKPSFANIGIAYGRTFSNSIHAGALVRIISERIDDLNASGVAVDAGIQYVTGPLDNVHFGIALRNVGTPMRFRGDGLIFRGQAEEGEYNMSQSQRTEKFELPSLLNIGVGYDLFIDNLKNDKEIDGKHRLSIMANFTSNSFGKDHMGLGAEYGFKEMFMLRAAYRYEDGLTNVENRTNAHTGVSAGFSLEVPVSKEKENSPKIGIDYSYRTSNPFKGTHTFGVRLLL